MNIYNILIWMIQTFGVMLYAIPAIIGAALMFVENKRWRTVSLILLALFPIVFSAIMMAFGALFNGENVKDWAEGLFVIPLYTIPWTISSLVGCGIGWFMVKR